MLDRYKITAGTARAYTIPTDAPEADGTIAWDKTTLMVVELQAGGLTGIGYTYGHRATAVIARELIGKFCIGKDPLDTNALFSSMRVSQRNYGAEGIGATALSAVDIAIWDLKAKVLGLPLASLLGVVRKAAPVYGSGGFTTYTDTQLAKQLEGWAGQGIPRVKMKVASHPEQDRHRMAVARKAIGSNAELFIDANGAYSRKQASYFAELAHAEQGVTWFEEPVSSDDLVGLELLCRRAPAGMDIAAGEYGWNAAYLGRMMRANAVDVIQADATRCGGVTGFMEAASLADAHPLPLSAHCGPTIHMHLACAARPLRHVEYFHDHVRIESMFFDGFCSAQDDGCMHPDFAQPGLGIEFKKQDAERFAEN
ncbi:MAG TPA: enolase C-terminal domain-like protein [Acidobacteriaceae bacterium]|nr:enolase C-terminal domain-like protein [Acidobacteriaceae bacterium]